MDENRNKITYDEGWQSATNYEYPQTLEIDDDEDKQEEQDEIIREKRKKDSPKQLLITIQLIVCLIIALAAFIIKGIGGDLYAAARDWYYTNLNNSVIFDGNNDFDLNSLFGTATKDEV